MKGSVILFIIFLLSTSVTSVDTEMPVYTEAAVETTTPDYTSTPEPTYTPVPTATPSPTPSPTPTPIVYTEDGQFTQGDVDAAQDVIKSYFNARLNKDTEAMVACYHPSRLTMEDVNNGKTLFEDEVFDLIDIHNYDANIQNKYYDYIYGEFTEGNKITILVDFNVTFPDGGADNSSFDEGMYYDWSVILVRDSEKSPWQIYGQGMY